MDLGLVDALAQLSFLVHNALADIAARRDLSMVQVRLLGVLRDREPTMNELGRLLALDKSSITGLVDRAQRRDLVTRTVSAADRRVTQVSITPAGRALAEEVVAEFTARIADAVAPLPAADRRTLTRLASRIVTADATHRGIDLVQGNKKGKGRPLPPPTYIAPPGLRQDPGPAAESPGQQGAP